MSTNIEIQKRCVVCGNMFTARTTVTKYCSASCTKRAYTNRVRNEKIEKAQANERQNLSLDKRLAKIQEKPIITISDAATYLGVSRPTIYKYIETGQIKYTRLGSKFLIKRIDIDILFTTKEYVRPEHSEKVITEFYTIEEIMEKYKVKKGCIYNRIKKKKIPKVIKRGIGYYSRTHVDSAFKSDVDPKIEEWYTVEELSVKLNESANSIYLFVSRNLIPKKREGQTVFYSKYHFDVARGFIQPIEERYYSVEEAMEKFNLTRDRLYYYTKFHNIPKQKVGKYIKISAPELDAIFEPPQIK